MRLGTDIVEIERIAAAVERNAQFPTKILSEKELVLFRDMKEQRQHEFLAGRFSVKEAYAKALGTGIGKIKFTDIVVLPNEMGAPKVVEGPIVESVIVSISHSKAYATATVIIDLPDFVINSQITSFLN